MKIQTKEKKFRTNVKNWNAIFLGDFQPLWPLLKSCEFVIPSSSIFFSSVWVWDTIEISSIVKILIIGFDLWIANNWHSRRRARTQNFFFSMKNGKNYWKEKSKGFVAPKTNKRRGKILRKYKEIPFFQWIKEKLRWMAFMN